MLSSSVLYFAKEPLLICFQVLNFAHFLLPNDVKEYTV